MKTFDILSTVISFTINFYQRWVFIIADGGTLTSSFSKDARQQETLKHSVDQDTSAQGVYFRII